MPTIKFYENVAGTLSKPSKMPGYGYGLPALESCKTGSKLAQIPGTSCHDCYACKGRYTFPAVKQAQRKRMAAVHDPRWVEAMVQLIGSKSEKYFRWHDSGDLLSRDHLSKIIEIAVRLPDYQFWLPTQEHDLVTRFLKDGGKLPSNLRVRFSTPKIDGRPVTAPAGVGTSGVHKAQSHGHVCPAKDQGNQCGSCRACWDSTVQHVSYPFH